MVKNNFFPVTSVFIQWHIQSLLDNVKPQWVPQKYHQKVIDVALKKNKAIN